METYNTRALRFFLSSIRTLKKESGGQRWNEICEDAASLFEHLYVKQFGPFHFRHEDIWELLFDPPEATNDPQYMRFEILCSKEGFVDFFMTILQALLDPPTSWWQSQFTGS